MKRREFITLLGGAAARGRSGRGRSRASGCAKSACFMYLAANDAEGQARLAALALKQLAMAATCGSKPAGPRAMRYGMARNG